MAAGKIMGVTPSSIKTLLGASIAAVSTFMGCGVVVSFNTVASNNLKYSYDTEVTAPFSWTGYTKMSALTIPVSPHGVQRVKVDIKTNQTEPEGHIDIYFAKNGTRITTPDVTGNGTYSTKSADVTVDWTAGDELAVYARATMSGDTMYTRNLRIYWDVAP